MKNFKFSVPSYLALIFVSCFVASIFSFSNATFVADIHGIAGIKVDYANFHALMPSNNALPIAIGSPIEFPNVGPAQTPTGIVALTTSTFNLAIIGDYKIEYQASVTEDGQLCVMVNGVQDPRSVAGRSSLFSQITNSYILRTTLPNTVISVNVAAGSFNALTLTASAGGTDDVSAQLVITRLA